MTRRDILKYGVVAGGGILLSTKGLVPRLFANTPQSPQTTPFMDELPVPNTVQRLANRISDLDVDAQTFAGPNASFYKIIAMQRQVHYHSQLPPTGIWGYVDGNPAAPPPLDAAPGPTFMSRISADRFSGNIVRVQNNLPSNTTGFGLPQLTTHFHGGHQPSRSDGFPAKITVNGKTFDPVIQPNGGHFDHTFPQVDPGSISDVADPSDRPSTLWYHDHILDSTGANVYRGLAGFYLVFDELDTGNEYTGLRLPSGQFDVPLVIQDRMFAPDGSLVFDPFNHDGFLGDKFVVNGKIQPYLNVQGRKYRFRFLNGSNARFYQMFLTNSAGKSFPMTMIGTDGGLTSRPLPNTGSFMIAPAERYEVIVDFSAFQPGETVYFENRLVQDEGRGPKGTFEEPELTTAGTRMLQFRVGERVDDSHLLDVTLPGVQLRPFQPISDAEKRAALVTTIEFDRSHGAWTLNGELAGDLSRPLVSPRLNQPQILRLINKSGGWWHPNHIHSEFGRVLSRNGRSPSPTLSEQDGVARKDVVILGPNTEVDVFLKFRDYAGPFVFHCHNLAHEDMAMMARFDVTTTAGQTFF
jgi:FtsP/CotA-like multicopper oxidase with cupredoxin domain